MRKSDMTPFMKRMRKGTCLRPESARAILHAERYAYAARRPLNVFITMKFPKVSKSGDKPYDVFRKKFWENTRRRWNTMVKENRAFSPFDAIAVFENPPTSSKLGRRHHGPLHVHWMLRWPFRKCKRLLFFLRRQFQREFGVALPSSVRMQRVRYGPRAAAYLAKGIDAPFAKHFHIDHAPQGPIAHRRMIISRSLGPTARKRAKAAGRDPLPKKRKGYYRKFRPVDLTRLIGSVGWKALPQAARKSSNVSKKHRPPNARSAFAMGKRKRVVNFKNSPVSIQP
jgi:hypothetical protein